MNGSEGGARRKNWLADENRYTQIRNAVMAYSRGKRLSRTRRGPTLAGSRAVPPHSVQAIDSLGSLHHLSTGNVTRGLFTQFGCTYKLGQ